MGFIILAAMLGVIPGAIAANKGHSFGLWWLYGTLLFIAALPHALLIGRPRHEFGQCPHCAEDVKLIATVCPHCQRDLAPMETAAVTSQ